MIDRLKEDELDTVFLYGKINELVGEVNKIIDRFETPDLLMYYEDGPSILKPSSEPSQDQDPPQE